MKLDIRTVEPSQLKAELLRLRDVEKMDFLENLIGMDWFTCFIPHLPENAKICAVPQLTA